MKTSRKVVSLAALIRKLKQQKSRIKISSCSGSFDLLHAGHISYLEEARSHGDALVVFLNTDESIALYKGPGRPIVPFKERAALLAAFPFVDYIIPLSELNPVSLIEKLRPEVFCNGADWGKFAAERTVVEECGGKFIIVSAHTRALMSTSDLVARAAQARAQPVQRAVFFECTDIPILLEKFSETKQFLKTMTRAGWLCFITTHSRTNTKTATPNELSELVTRTIAAKKSLSGRDTSLFEIAAQKHCVVLSKSWHIAFSGTGTSNARLANMKTAIVGHGDKTFTSTLNRPDVVCATLPEMTRLLIS